MKDLPLLGGLSAPTRRAQWSWFSTHSQCPAHNCCRKNERKFGEILIRKRGKERGRKLEGRRKKGGRREEERHTLTSLDSPKCYVLFTLASLCLWACSVFSMQCPSPPLHQMRSCIHPQQDLIHLKLPPCAAPLWSRIPLSGPCNPMFILQFSSDFFLTWVSERCLAPCCPGTAGFITGEEQSHLPLCSLTAEHPAGAQGGLPQIPPDGILIPLN